MSNKLQIGNITTGYRNIKSGKEFDKYFPNPNSQDKVIIEDGEVSQTLDLMKKVVWKYINDTKKIAPLLKAESVSKTAQNIWEFLYNHIQYRLDKKGLEQLRRPARSWSERTQGIDCDCFSIFASSLLTNLRIQHSFRITKYDSNLFQHVYVIIPISTEEYIIIDPVLSKFNYEKPFTEKKDYKMSLNGIDIAVLSGHENKDLYDAVMSTALDGLGLGNTSEQDDLNAIYSYLISTRNAIAQNPDSIKYVDDPKAFLKMLDYAIKYWNTPNRDKALEELEKAEDKLNQSIGIYGIDDLDEYDELLGRLFKRRSKAERKKRRKSFFKKVKKVVKAPKKVLTKVKNAIVKISPLTISARSGFLLALKLNVKKMSSKLRWAYLSESEAAKHGISRAYWLKSKSALEKVEKIFADKLRGDRKTLKKAILSSKPGKKAKGLGEPVSAAAAGTLIATATPIIVATMKALKKAGLLDKNESEEVSENEVKNAFLDENNLDSENDYSDFDVDEGLTPDYTDAIKPFNSNNKAGSNENNNGKMKPLDFIKKNPMVGVGIIGALGFGGYFLYSSMNSSNAKPKAKQSLKGTKKTNSTTKKNIKTIQLD